MRTHSESGQPSAIGDMPANPWFQCSRRVIRFVLAAILGLFAFANPAQAQDPGQTDSADAEVSEAEKEPLRQILDLGSFRIKDHRPTRNETAKVTFKMHLAFTSELTEKQVEQLQSWKHRLRNQVIITIRTLDLKEFQEPDLASLRRKVLIRINRLFKAKLAEEVLLTQYLFRTN